MLMLPDFHVKQRDFLLEISRAITARLELSEVLRRVLHASLVMLGGQVGVIALRAADGEFYVRATSGIKSDQLPSMNNHLHELTLIALEQGLEDDAFEAKLAQMAKDISSDLRQSIAMPLAFASEPLGMMIVFRNYSSAATANDLQILRSFADQAAIAVHNAQLYERITQERHHLDAILQHNADGVMILDTTLTIVRFNRALERITGWAAQDAIGLHQDDVFAWKRLEHGDLQAAIGEGWPYILPEDTREDTPLYVEGDLLRRDGLSLSIGITYAPMLASDGHVENIIANVRDITNFRRAQEMQSTFISVVSHELKTPVALIKGYAATLRRPDVEWDRQTMLDNLAVIEDEADRLDRLIQDLLTASKIQAQGEISLQLDDVYLDQLATRSVERFSSQTNRHNFKLKFEPGFPSIQADQTRMLQVIDNLVSNAIKYSPNGGLIEVGGHYDDKWVTIYIKDPGVGLSADDRTRVFERFFRVDGRLTRKTQGTGLGLFLAKAIVEAHNGKIDVDSQPGEGSTFFFTLPRTQIINPTPSETL
jgi:PAS domain S-box-containing protein